ncbi:MAG: hypothetical protein Pg6C_08390 [Treponemataceae bacterium]|nr:MAG: hypothetical protein Pg6C_08390 [Treponemataceae bacterium]
MRYSADIDTHSSFPSHQSCAQNYPLYLKDSLTCKRAGFVPNYGKTRKFIKKTWIATPLSTYHGMNICNTNRLVKGLGKSCGVM